MKTQRPLQTGLVGAHRHAFAPHPNPDWITHVVCTTCHFALPRHLLTAALNGGATMEEVALRPADQLTGYVWRTTRVADVREGDVIACPQDQAPERVTEYKALHGKMRKVRTDRHVHIRSRLDCVLRREPEVA